MKIIELMHPPVHSGNMRVLKHIAKQQESDDVNVCKKKHDELSQALVARQFSTPLLSAPAEFLVPWSLHSSHGLQLLGSYQKTNTHKEAVKGSKERDLVYLKWIDTVNPSFESLELGSPWKLCF